MAASPLLHGSTAPGDLAPRRRAERPSSPTRRTPDPAPQRPAPQRPVPQRPSVAKQPPLTLTRRGRLVLVGLPIALGVASLLMLGAFLSSVAQASEAEPEGTRTTEVAVSTGETLWGLAMHYAPERDPRDVVAEMVELNELHSSVVQPGQSIAVPVSG
ncbi:LysM peptidoglycan-binding domain-containing protein [Arthrobacter echini]|uniref:LysM peptidoglycan-binding domain-containing protein n=2 Tax=Arthrobacter echini TaxID=1529066 RepID=A0A4S5E0W8_9MICC|nr:LysM peptidoglycan-binding domain-containing protein [Arthrobacter echini]